MKLMSVVGLALAVSACNTQKRQPVPDSGQVSAGVVTNEGDASSPANSRFCGDEILSDEGVGNIRIGESVGSVRRKCTVLRDATELGAEGMPSRKIALLFPRDTVLGEIVDEKVWRVEIHSPHFSTADSLRVGTPLARLLGLRKPQGLTGEGALFVMSPDHCGLSFRLSETGSPILRDPSPAALSRLPTGTHVTNILIVGCHR
jgi:hypothetical protein